MRKWFIWFAIISLLFTVSGCVKENEGMQIGTESAHPTIEESEPPTIILDNLAYWDLVHNEIIAMLNEHNLYVAAINSSYPCVLYEVEPGIQTDDGQIVASGLTQEEYEKLYHHIKEELHAILDKYKLAKPKSAFHGCDSIVGLFFHNWFIDGNMVYNNVESRDVAVYELDLLKYYHEYEEKTYICAEGFFPDLWSEYPVYTL